MKAPVVWEFVLGLIRHGLTFGGGWLVTAGVASQSEADTAIGGIITVLGLAWSWYRKWDRERQKTL